MSDKIEAAEWCEGRAIMVHFRALADNATADPPGAGREGGR